MVGCPTCLIIAISSIRRSRPGWYRRRQKSICGRNVHRLKTRDSLVVALLMLWSAHSSSWKSKTVRRSSISSRLFVYYNERMIEGTVNQDSGAFIRDGIKSLAKLGVCTEAEWPYKISRFTKKPTPACYRSAKKHRILSYHRISTVDEMRSCLAEGFPCVFGFTVYEAFE